MTNNNVPLSHQAESNQGLSVIVDATSPQNRPNLSVNRDQRSIIEVPNSAEVEGRPSQTTDSPTKAEIVFIFPQFVRVKCYS